MIMMIIIIIISGRESVCVYIENARSYIIEHGFGFAFDLLAKPYRVKDDNDKLF